MHNQQPRHVNSRVLAAVLTTLILSPTSPAAADPKLGPVVLEIKGYVVPARQVAIVPKVAGEVVEMLIEVGKRVKAGDVLAKLDPVEYQIAVRIARAELALAEAGVAKAKSGSATADLDIARAKVEVARAHLELAQHRLDGAVVRAPFEGVVLSKRADVGTRIEPRSAPRTSGLCVLADSRMMDVEIWIAEKDLARVATGQSCVIRLEAFPQKTYRGRVLRILPVADRAKGAVGVRIRIEVPESDTSLRPDMAALVTIMAAS